jgi:N-sulfoglucosamine sulfohydrolase
MKIKLFPLNLAVIGMAVALQSASSAEPTAAAEKPRNVVLIFADDMGYTMAATGTPGIQTPNLDRMMKDGMSFTQAFSAQAVCSPSRGAVLTGMLPDSNGIDILTTNPDITKFPEIAVKPAQPKTYRAQVHEDIPTLPEILKEHGYFSAITQKLHVEPAWKFPFSKGYNYHNRPQNYGRLIDEVVRDSDGKPFFLMANISSPHRPYDVHLRANDLLNPDGTVKGIDPAKIEVPPYLPDTPGMRRDLAKYYACVQITDACVGAVMDGLRRNGLLDSTLVIFSSDNGFPYHRAKVSDFPAGMHEPFIAQGKNIAPGKVCDVPISLIDVMPTFLSYLGIPVPKRVQGRSLLPLLEGKSGAVAGRDTIYGMTNEHYLGRMVTNGRYYYVKRFHRRSGTWTKPPMNEDLYQQEPWGNYSFAETVAARESHPAEYAWLREIVDGEQPEEALYDLQNDPWGMTNLIDNPEYKQVADTLRTKLKEWRTLSGDEDYISKRTSTGW